MSGIAEVAGRFTTRLVAGVRTRLMLAKNPAGWSELLDLVANDDGPIVISINARTADGADPSWLWDVPFERLAPRVVVATGDRCRDLSVRLQYAGAAHVTVEDPTEAVATAHADSRGHIGRVDVIGNYTAFAELLAAGTPEPIETGPVESHAADPDLHAAAAHVADVHGAEATGDRSGGS
jgi:UDP-N-acetylmuramyl tripeptide synthase